MDKIIKTSSFITVTFSPAEKRIFSAIKRDVLKEIPVPKNTDYLMVDIIACEYIKYVRALGGAAVADGVTTIPMPRMAIASAKAIREYLAELTLTPKSRAETNTASTLSTIFKILNKGDDNAGDKTTV